MIRWGYLIPRLVLAAALAAFLTYGLAPLVRWAAVTYGSRALGAKIEIDSLELSLARVNAKLCGVQVANPSSPAKNLFRASHLQLDLDRDALLQHRLVVREGRISGLRIDAPRDTSGALDWPDSTEPAHEWDRAAFCRQWLLPIAGRLREDLESDLVTPGLCRELAERWPNEYRRLESEIDTLKDRGAKLKELVREIREAKSIPDPQRIEHVAGEIEGIRGQLEGLPGDVRRLRDQVKQDAVSIQEGRDHDVAVLRSKLDIQSLNGESLSQYLLSGEQAARVQELLAWVEWTRNCIPRRREFVQPQRFRGRIVRFGDARPLPEVVFERLALDGEFRHDGELVPFTGTVTGVTNRPAVYGQPAVVDVKTGPDAPLHVHAVLDRTGRIPHDRLVIDLPHWKMPARQLGDPQQFALTLEPGQAAVRLEIDLRDDELAGQLAFVQQSVQLETTLANAYGGETLKTRLNQALAHVTQLNVTVDLSGTLRRPRTRLHSDLGPQIAGGLTIAARQEVQMRVEQLTGLVDREVHKHLSELEGLVNARTDELLARLDAPRAELEQLVAAKPGQWKLDHLNILPQPIRAGQLPNLPAGVRFTR
jgi:uncharacterized protein (TIGR03545 family)